MAISRPLLFALIGALVLLAAVTAMRVIGGGSEAATPSQQSAASPALKPITAPDSPAGPKAAPPKAAPRKAPTEPAPRADRPPARRTAGQAGGEGVARRVGRAVAQGRVVVLVFSAQGHDDRATRAATRKLRGTGAAVFTDSVYRLDEYARLVGALPVTRVPATIVIGTDRRARVIEGFADSGSLRQLVADAR